ncbi:ABC transporter ATP-binding protein [Stappia sp.]|uniref:ABC transporter ATP-binding protein n=1 Tax=Stappia sp. TaxID=1870903 RepID=UPI003A993475
MAFLELHGLTKDFAGVPAVSELTIMVEKGEFVSLLGPSGCGKTTTLNMIAGFLDPSAGNIRLNNTSLKAVRPRERRLGVVFQTYALFPHMTVAENIAFGLEMLKVPQPDARRRVADVIDLVRLAGMAHRFPAQLSGGQQQRVALARALVIEPPLLLLDEPLSNLDAKLRDDMQGELRRIQRTVGTTTIMVTHDQAEAMALSDRIAVMNQGKLEQAGSPQEVYDKPASAFVSGFLGKTNLLSGRLQAGGGGSGVLEIAGHHFRAPDDQALVQGPVKVSLRPEHIRIGSGEEGFQDKVEGQVHSRVFLGDRWIYDVNCALGTVLVYSPNGTAPFEEGQHVTLSWDALKMRVVEACHA